MAHRVAKIIDLGLVEDRKSWSILLLMKATTHFLTLSLTEARKLGDRNPLEFLLEKNNEWEMMAKITPLDVEKQWQFLVDRGVTAIDLAKDIILKVREHKSAIGTKFARLLLEEIFPEFLTYDWEICSLCHVYDYKIVEEWELIMGQPKLDGIRARYIITRDGVESAMTRKGKKIRAYWRFLSDHEAHEICFHTGCDRIVLDGEIYGHGLSLQEINSVVMDEKKEDDKIKFHIFDIIDEEKRFLQRFEDMLIIQECWSEVVMSHMLKSHVEFEEYAKNQVIDGYEGAIARDPNAYYQRKRSYGLLKWKPHRDATGHYVKVRIKDGRETALFFIGVYEDEPVSGYVSRTSFMDTDENSFTSFSKRVLTGERVGVKVKFTETTKKRVLRNATHLEEI